MASNKAGAAGHQNSSHLWASKYELEQLVSFTMSIEDYRPPTDPGNGSILSAERV